MGFCLFSAFAMIKIWMRLAGLPTLVGNLAPLLALTSSHSRRKWQLWGDIEVMAMAMPNATSVRF